MAALDSLLIHASCVAVEGRAALIAGPSGAGKSDLALRLIESGAQLVADDRTVLHCEKDALFAAPPPQIAGLLELRHAGILRLPFIAPVAVALYVELAPQGENLERMPQRETVFLLDRPVQRLRLHAFSVSTAAKIKAILRYPFAHD